ncbi:cytochrome P450 [Diplogelasinospora grovesii]|uniref:Cytochrome P450 n=1 Tax=Diplogelasinospora grovesii TaxID=303347 RepID=A0AAN6MVK3_9PEZI|nr:cytochrome P450 [Diplogelasinospora grovesii]
MMVATVTLAFVAVALYLLYQRLLPKPLPGIPYNPEATKSLWGDEPALTRYLSANGEFSSWLGEQCLKLGSPVVQIFVQPFQMPWILVADFHEAQDILMRRTDFEKPQFLIDGLAALGDFHARYRTAEDAFRSRRQLRQDLMAPKFLNNYIGPFAHTKGLELVKLFEAKTNLANGRPFRVREDYARAVLDLMLYHAFGETYDESAMEPQLDLLAKLTPSSMPKGRDIDEPVPFPEAPRSFFLELLHETAEIMERTTISPTPQLSFWWWSKQGWFKKIVSERHRVMAKQLHKAAANLQAGKVQSALEHMMMREQAAAEKQGREPRVISQSMSDEIFADPMTGHHTTSSAMTWVTKYLTGYPHTQSKLRDELYSSIPEAVEEKRPPTFEELRRAKLPYLEAVIEEARRLTPFVIVREAAQDLEILGHKIPKGAQCFMVSAGPGITLPSVPVKEETRSPSSKVAKPWGKWDESRDLKLFEPERWLVQREDGSLDFDATAGPQLGFGMGTRQCWGRRLAQLAIRTVIALVVWEFEMLEIPEDLGGYAGLDGISREPVRAFARLRKITPYKV